MSSILLLLYQFVTFFLSGISASVVAGCLYGLQFMPVTLVQQSRKGASQNGEYRVALVKIKVKEGFSNAYQLIDHHHRFDSSFDTTITKVWPIGASHVSFTTL